ncbi:MAG: DNA polymerase III [Treponema sp.]|nr:DNA polymerase III [Treponema sp.]
MFDNLLYQNASSLLHDDIVHHRLPGAILLAGPASSGKLTCALEIARVLSCTAREKRGSWMCDCPSCRKNKELASTNVLLAGPRDCSLEILAAKKAFLTAAFNNAPYLTAARYLFLRSVRKLTMRFSQVLWEADDKVSKIAPVMQAIDEQMELLDPAKPLVENEKLEKICDEIIKQADKLESTFMYDSLPIQQIRSASSWAHMKSPDGKKVFIIENADRMNEAARNALLKILEEPPEDTVFILTTNRRGAVMPTILSRVRCYNFSQRTEKEQAEVLDRVFHANNSEQTTIDSYLQTFLPVTPSQVQDFSRSFYASVEKGAMPLIQDIVKGCAGFEPRILFKIFLTGILDAQKTEELSPRNVESAAKNVAVLRDIYNNVSVYNQSPAAALENLWRELFAVYRLERR